MSSHEWVSVEKLICMRLYSDVIAHVYVLTGIVQYTEMVA